MRIAIVTGASAGMGVEFVQQLDASGEVDEVWMIARRQDRMEELAQKLKGRSRIFALDLAAPDALTPLSAALTEARPDVRYLVNNAGFGLFGHFAELPLDRQLQMVDLNVRALTALTHVVLPWCQKGSRIVLVSSTIAWYAVPGAMIYAATKAYVNSFAVALYGELGPKGIGVTVVCPGPVETEFLGVATHGGRSKMGIVAADPAAVVRVALRHARWGWLHSVYGLHIKFVVAVAPLIPRNLLAWVGGRFHWWKMI